MFWYYRSIMGLCLRCHYSTLPTGKLLSFFSPRSRPEEPACFGLEWISEIGGCHVQRVQNGRKNLWLRPAITFEYFLWFSSELHFSHFIVAAIPLSYPSPFPYKPIQSPKQDRRGKDDLPASPRTTGTINSTALY
jgi:hypothetical protein